MSCGILDNYEPFPNANHLDDEARWTTLHVHGRDVSIEEGLLVPYEFQYNGEIREVCFTDRLYAKYAPSPDTMERIATTGLKKLAEPRRKDTEYLKQRKIGDILVVQDRYGITFMEPSDF